MNINFMLCNKNFKKHAKPAGQYDFCCKLTRTDLVIHHY